MTRHEQILVRVAADGSVQAETRGIKGAKCLESIQLLEELLDAVTQTSTFTAEYSENTAEITSEVDDELQQQ